MTAAADRAGPAGAERPQKLRLTFAASCGDVRAALADLRSFLQGAGLSADACGTAEIVLAEALNNVAEHAYAMSGSGTIQLEVTLMPGALAANITDEGAPLPGLCLPHARNPTPGKPAKDGAGQDLPEGGFGWFLIHNLTSSLRYRRLDGRNHLHLGLDLTSAGGAD
jgi:serine/threonine-protein kinase RsbW